MGRALAVGAAAALLDLSLYATALAWVASPSPDVAGPSPDVLPALFLLLAYVGIGAASGHAAVSLTGGIAQSWPAVVIVAGTSALLIGWGHDSAALHPMLNSALAAAGGGACTAAGGWLGLVLPNLHRAKAPVNVLAGQRTVELRVLPSALIASVAASRASTGRHHRPPPAKSAPRPTPQMASVSEPAIGPDILEFGS